MEAQTTGLKRQIQVDEVYFVGKSAFQENAVVKTTAFGKALFMDKQIQSAEKDECVYHESLVIPAMLLHGNPRSVFIGGGGEFATAREILKFASVERVTMVDIDEEACRQCLKHLPSWGDGCIADKRLKVVYGDALAYLRESKEKYDVVVMDIADPVEAGPGFKLYTKEFYQDCSKKNLNPGGVFVTQSTAADYIVAGESFATIHNTLKTAFDVVIPYRATIMSFGGPWGFNVAWNRDKSLPKDVFQLSVQQLDERLQKRYRKDAKKPKFYDGRTHQNIFSLPLNIRRILSNSNLVSTLENPVYMV